ncbi:hypothetical protein [Nodosilinea sp. P-1105]|uniref:hypothetical protein n=1 Tax=Nodosilinea sp. P-1105 TaxID=2546229 RepID=UPI00146B08FF|nr:hypothetical protein [Nodosilinea sp. P-1105]NMF85189.1 hypothetical protein [Nodosilinea sp. P-1105]
MTNPTQSPDVAHFYQLLSDFSFDTETYPAEAMVAAWLQQYETIWISHAITEALYQGRYKLISVDQILQLWQRRGHPIRHFNREFESIILGQTLLCPSGYGEMPPLQAQMPTTDAPQGDSPPSREPSLTSGAGAPQGEQVASQAAASAGDVAGNVVDQEGEERHGAPNQATDMTKTASTDATVPNFRPLSPDSSAWTQTEVIQPFVPALEVSGLHQRLKAVVQGGLRS